MKQLALVSLVTLGCVSAVSAQTVTRAGADRVSVRATDVPLTRLLEELAVIQPLEIVYTEERVRTTPVSITLDGVTVDQAVRAVLHEAGVDCAVGGIVGQPLQVFVGKAGSARPSAGAARETVAGHASNDETPAVASASAAATPAPPDNDREGERRAVGARGGSGFGAASMAANAANTPSAAPPDAVDAPPPMVDTAGASDTIEVTNPTEGPAFTMVGENVTYHDPNFVSYRNSDAAKKARMSVDVSKIP